MEPITEEECIELIKEKFPKFPSYWESYIRDHGSDLGITIQMLPFCKYTLDVIKSNDVPEIKKIFSFVEFLLCNGDNEIQFATFVKFLGKTNIKYCKAWDEFTGVKTKGLWDN